MSLPLPAWLAAVPPEDRAVERKKFLMRIAALYATKAGNMSQLADQLGVTQQGLNNAVLKVRPLTPEMTIAVEKLVGRDKLPRELLNPEVYQIAE